MITNREDRHRHCNQHPNGHNHQDHQGETGFVKACNMRKGPVIKLLSMVVESNDLYSGFQKLCFNYTTGKTSENNQTKMTEDRSIIEFLLTPPSDSEFVKKTM